MLPFVNSVRGKLSLVTCKNTKVLLLMSRHLLMAFLTNLHKTAPLLFTRARCFASGVMWRNWLFCKALITGLALYYLERQCF